MGKICYFLCALIFALSAATFVGAQFDNDPSNRVRTEPLPQNIQETLAKQRIADEEEQFEELIKRGEQAAQISEVLADSFEKRQTLTSDDRNKLKDLEKLIKGIRKDLGGGDDDDANEISPDSTAEAIESLKEAASDLVDEIKKSNRHTISAVAIEGSNALLKLVRFLRFSK